MQITAQILGIIALVVAILSMLFKTKTKILLFCNLYNILNLISLLLLGQYLGCILVGIAIIKGVVFYFFARKNLKPSIYVLIIFEIIVIAVSIILWKSWYEIFMVINLIINMYATWQDNVIVLKIGVIICSILLILYDSFAGAYTYIIDDTFFCLSALYSILIYRKNKNTQQVE